jgi:hypothetical protein
MWSHWQVIGNITYNNVVLVITLNFYAPHSCRFVCLFAILVQDITLKQQEEST